MSEKRIRKSIYRLVQRVISLQDEAKKLGIFIGDRELISCPRCGLMEDVDVNEKLLTCRPGSLGVDTGLAFEELDSDAAIFFRAVRCLEKYSPWFVDGPDRPKPSPVRT